MTTALACPVCGAALTLGPKMAQCPAQHAFDRARSGYLNLLMSNKKQSAEPGDSADMLNSRRTFLGGGFYNLMSDAACDAVRAVVGTRVDAQVADLGCGEGFFTTRLDTALTRATGESPRCHGVDISRAGIKMAAGTSRHIEWVVASLHNSPFAPQSLDAVLSMFAPIDAADVHRVLKSDGALITVTPGPDHLDALRVILYTSVKPHPKTPTLMLGDTLFGPAETTRVRYPIVIDTPEQIMNLLAMTPFGWHASRDARAYLEALPKLEVTVDVYVSVFRPRPQVQP